jgi:hypothetical protein
MMGTYATQNLTWTPSTIFEECRKEIDAKFPHGWTGLQKHCCLGPVFNCGHHLIRRCHVVIVVYSLFSR